MSNFRLDDRVCLYDFYCDHSQLSNMELEKLVELFNHNEHSSATVGNLKDLNPTIRRSNIIWFDDDFMMKNNCNDINQKIVNRMNEINDLAFKFDLLVTESLQLTQYTSKDKGFYDFHIDANTITGNLTRKLSFVIQLSDPSEFTGGEFCMIMANGKEYNLSQMRPEAFQKGNIIAFPSFIPHKVTPVTSGVRHSLVGWCLGTRFR